MIKQGVRLYGVRPEMAVVDAIVQAVFRAHSIPCVRTSFKRDGTGISLHNVGFAGDYRTRHITGKRRIETIKMIGEDLKAALPCCDIVMHEELFDTEQEHIHVEFDPKDDAAFQRDKTIYRETGQWPQS